MISLLATLSRYRCSALEKQGKLDAVAMDGVAGAEDDEDENEDDSDNLEGGECEACDDET